MYRDDRKVHPRLRDPASWLGYEFTQPRTRFTVQLYTAGMVKKGVVWNKPAARGGQDTGSANLGPTFLTIPVSRSTLCVVKLIYQST